MALINVKRSSLFLRQNATPPTPPANFIETNTPLIVVPNFTQIETNRLSGQMNSRDFIVDTCRSASSFLASVDIRPPTLNNPAEYNELLKISGFSETIGADTVTLENNTGVIDRASALVYMDGNKFTFTNTLVGNTEIVLNVGEIGKVNTTLSGYIDDPVPVAEVNPTVTLNQDGLAVVSCADIITRDGTVVPAQGVKFSTNPEITNLYTMGGTAGIKTDAITDYSLTCEITFPVDSLVFGTDASMIEAGSIESILVIIGADASGLAVDGQSIIFTADTSKAVTYSDDANENLLQRILTLRLYDDGATPALKIETGNVSGL